MVSMMLNDILKTKNQEHGGLANYVHESNLIFFNLKVWQQIITPLKTRNNNFYTRWK